VLCSHPDPLEQASNAKAVRTTSGNLVVEEGSLGQLPDRTTCNLVSRQKIDSSSYSHMAGGYILLSIKAMTASAY